MYDDQQLTPIRLARYKMASQGAPPTRHILLPSPSFLRRYSLTASALVPYSGKTPHTQPLVILNMAWAQDMQLCRA